MALFFSNCSQQSAATGGIGGDGVPVLEYDEYSPTTSAGLEFHRKRLEDDNYCKPNTSYIWCLPRDYNQEKHPVTCEYQSYSYSSPLVAINSTAYAQIRISSRSRCLGTTTSSSSSKRLRTSTTKLR